MEAKWEDWFFSSVRVCEYQDWRSMVQNNLPRFLRECEEAQWWSCYSVVVARSYGRFWHTVGLGPTVCLGW